MNPGSEMLSMMASRGIPLVIGSDAHVPDRVGSEFISALELAGASGYREVQMMWGRRRHPAVLSEMHSPIYANRNMRRPPLRTSPVARLSVVGMVFALFPWGLPCGVGQRSFEGGKSAWAPGIADFR